MIKYDVLFGLREREYWDIVREFVREKNNIPNIFNLTQNEENIDFNNQNQLKHSNRSCGSCL